MTWVAIVAAALLLAVAVRQAAIWLRPGPETGLRRCPHCGSEFEGERRYCVACGGQIWDDVLSEK